MLLKEVDFDVFDVPRPLSLGDAETFVPEAIECVKCHAVGSIVRSHISGTVDTTITAIAYNLEKRRWKLSPNNYFNFQCRDCNKVFKFLVRKSNNEHMYLAVTKFVTD